MAYKTRQFIQTFFIWVDNIDYQHLSEVNPIVHRARNQHPNYHNDGRLQRNKRKARRGKKGINKNKNKNGNISSETGAAIKGIMLEIMEKHAGGREALNQQLGRNKARKKRQKERKQRRLNKAIGQLKKQKHTGHRRQLKSKRRFQKNTQHKEQERKDLDAKRQGLFKNTNKQNRKKDEPYTKGGRTFSKKARQNRLKGKKRGHRGQNKQGHRGRGRLRVVQAPKQELLVTPTPYNVTMLNITSINKTTTP